MLFIKHYLDSFTLSLSQVKTTHAWQHLAANILEVFAEGCEESNTAVFCSLTAVIWFQTSPARTATLKSIWTMTTRTEQTSQQRRNRLPLALTDHVAQRFITDLKWICCLEHLSSHTRVNSYQTFEAPVVQ